MRAVEGQSSGRNAGPFDRGGLVFVAVFVPVLILWAAVVAPALEDRAPWAASPWPVLVITVPLVVLYSSRRRRREWAEAGVDTHPSRVAAGRALGTGELPDDPAADPEIRALVQQTRARYGAFNRTAWLYLLVPAGFQLLLGIASGDVARIGISLAFIALTPVLWWSSQRTAARWDHLDAALDARASASPSEAAG